MALLEVSAHDLGEVRFLALAGQLKMAEGDLRLREELRDELGRGRRRFVLDLGGVSFVDSAGLGELVACKKRVLELGGDLVLLRPQPRVRELLLMTRLVDVLGVYDDADEAARAV